MLDDIGSPSLSGSSASNLSLVGQPATCSLVAVTDRTMGHFYPWPLSQHYSDKTRVSTTPVVPGVHGGCNALANVEERCNRVGGHMAHRHSNSTAVDHMNRTGWFRCPERQKEQPREYVLAVLSCPAGIRVIFLSALPTLGAGPFGCSAVNGRHRQIGTPRRVRGHPLNSALSLLTIAASRHSSYLGNIWDFFVDL